MSISSPNFCCAQAQEPSGQALQVSDMSASSAGSLTALPVDASAAGTSNPSACRGSGGGGHAGMQVRCRFSPCCGFDHRMRCALCSCVAGCAASAQSAAVELKQSPYGPGNLTSATPFAVPQAATQPAQAASSSSSSSNVPSQQVGGAAPPAPPMAQGEAGEAQQQHGGQPNNGAFGSAAGAGSGAAGGAPAAAEAAGGGGGDDGGFDNDAIEPFEDQQQVPSSLLNGKCENVHIVCRLYICGQAAHVDGNLCSTDAQDTCEHVSLQPPAPQLWI